jgi:hypothetical protein
MLSNLVKDLRISEAQINFELNFELIQKENMKDNCSNGPLMSWHSGRPSNDFRPTWPFSPWPETGEGRPWSLGGGIGRFR